ncbi:MAG TPA: hypothetical protein VNK24_04375 [Elusimicrobiota bacterium]|nr:hypothetical protein [Elusimicrobiota bacterium]
MGADIQQEPFLTRIPAGNSMAPIGRGWALGVWGYALAWFLVNDRLKLAAYKVFDPAAPAILSK